MDYDLSVVPVPVDDHGRAIRVMATGAMAIPIAAIVWYLVTIPLNVLVTPGQLTILGMLCVFAGIAGYIVAGTGPGAIRCTMDDRGFTLRYRKRADRRFEWSDPHLHVSIGEVVTPKSTSYDLTTRLPFHNFVTPELYGTILDEARKRGLRVKVSRADQFSTKITSVDIRAPGKARSA
jgi:hypothetical protein